MSFRKVATTILNVILSITCVLFALVTALSIRSKLNNIPPIIFGKSHFQIVSSSMEASGFKVGDVVIVKLTNPKDIKIGDNIVFYQTFSNNNNLSIITSNSSTTNFNFPQYFGIGLSSLESAGKNGFDLWFHRVNNIYIDENNKLWFETYGTSNTDQAGEKILDNSPTSEDYVVGVYQRKSNLLTFIYGLNLDPLFVALCACALLLLVLGLNLLEYIDCYLLYKKLIERKISIFDPQVKPKKFKNTPIEIKAKILESAEPGELLEYKKKLFDVRYL